MKINFHFQKIFSRGTICAFAAATMNASAQFLPNDLNNPQAADNLPRDSWRLEKIEDYDWSRHFRVGMLAGFNMKADFRTTGTFAAGGGTPGVYDDGYVLTDDQNNAGGLTGNWGYQNASQISGNSLLMHRATSFSANSSSSSESAPNIGFDLAYGDSYWYWRHAKLGWELGIDILPVQVSGQMAVTANRTVDAFDITGVFMPPPGYQGSADTSGENAFIGSTPTSTTTGVPVLGTASEKMDAMIYTLRLGPTLYWDLTQSIGTYIGAGPAVGFVSGSITSSRVNFTDGTSASFKGSASGNSVIYGGYVNATLVYHAVEGGDFYLGGQFMPMSNATFSGSGRSGKLNLDGQLYITFGINWPF